MPTLSAAMRLSRSAMMARPERLRIRFSTTTSVTMMRMKPAVKVAMVSVPVAPCAPLMMATPSSVRPRSLTLRVPAALNTMCRPFSSWPTIRQLMSSLMISPKASVTMAR